MVDPTLKGSLLTDFFQAKSAKSAVKDAKEAKDAVQSELDDLLMVFGDLEEKLAQYKVRDLVVTLKLMTT